MLAATEQLSDARPIERRPAPRRAAPPPSQQIAVHTPLSIVQAALQSGNIEMYREAVCLAKEMDAITSRKAFDNAMADAKAEIPVIRKNQRVGYDSRKAGASRTDYMHEDLAEIARTIDPILGKHGLSYRFRATSNLNEPITVTCIISHREGHFEETTLRAARDDSGNKNAIQQIGSTITYLQRYTLKAALGLAAAKDDDGRSSEPATAQEEQPPASGCITQDQADQIRDALEAKGASRKAFLQWAKQPRVEDVPADQFAYCMQAIAKFRSAQR